MTIEEFAKTPTYKDGIDRYLSHIKETQKSVDKAWRNGENKCSYFVSIIIMIDQDRWLLDADKEMLKAKTHEAWGSIGIDQETAA